MRVCVRERRKHQQPPCHPYTVHGHSRQDVLERRIDKVLQTNVIWSVHEDEEEICTASLSFIQFLCSSYAESVVKRFCCVGQGAGLAGLLWNEVHPFNSIQW